MNNLNFIGSNVLFKLIFKQVFGLKSFFSATNYAKAICKLGRKLFFLNYNFAMQILASFFFHPETSYSNNKWQIFIMKHYYLTYIFVTCRLL